MHDGALGAARRSTPRQPRVVGPADDCKPGLARGPLLTDEPVTVLQRSFELPTLDLSTSSVLVTGGTGSFGRALVKSLLMHNPPRRLVIFSRDEQKQDTMAQELQALGPSLFDRLRFF